MNEERIEKLAQAIERAPHSREKKESFRPLDDDEDYEEYYDDGAVLLPVAFNLRWFRATATDASCQTAGCIAGFCVGLFSEESSSESYTMAVASLLAIDYEVASALCVPCGLFRANHKMSVVTPAQAAQAVRNVVPLLQRPRLPESDIELERALWSHAEDGD